MMRARSPGCGQSRRQRRYRRTQLIDFIYLDADLAVINKPSGVALLADRGGAPCLWDELREQLGRPLLVHRLDKGTSGVLAVARNRATQSRLTRAFQQRTVRKSYLALAVGPLHLRGTGCIDLPLRAGRKSRYRIAGPRHGIVRDGNRWFHANPEPGYASQTRLRVLRSGASGCCLLLQPLTGRTHQLRVHLSWIGHPILGDTLYGKPKALEQRADRLMLHALRLKLPGYPPMTAAFEDC